MGILFSVTHAPLLFLLFSHHIGVLVFSLPQQMCDRCQIRGLLHFIDINVTEGKRNLRKDTAPYRCTACQGNDYDSYVFPTAEPVLCQNTDISRIVLCPAFLQLFHVPVFNTGEFPQFLVIRVMSKRGLLILKQQI